MSTTLAACAACGSSSTDPGAAPAGDVGPLDTSDAVVSDADAADADDTHRAPDAADAPDSPGTPDVLADARTDGATVEYPAFRPTVPSVTSAGGPVLTSPKIVPIVFAGTTFATEIADFVPKAVASAEWIAQLAEYGVGAGTSVAPITAAALPSTTLTQAELEAFVQDQLGSGAWGVADSAEFGSSFYVLFLEPGVTISLPSGKTTCGAGPFGYHREVLVGATHTPYAVVADCVDKLDPVTKIAWHELVEGCTDPYIVTGRAFARVNAAWSQAFNGGEIGDMCEQRRDAKILPADVGYAIQRTWSNLSAQAYHDPCVPAATTPYFAAAPVLPDTVTLGAASVPGVKIAVGASRTIDVQLFSDGPTAGPFTVKAVEGRGGTSLAFSWDKTQGQDGDVLHLTIQATSAAPTGTTFVIDSSLAAATSQWVGAVEN